MKEKMRTQKWGWAILLALSAMLMLNGVGWFIMGPSLAFFELDTGVTLEAFREAYPTVTRNIVTNARQVAIWFLAFGTLALLVSWEGYRHGSRWAWIATWVVVAGPTAVGINVLAGGETVFGLLILSVSAVSLVGQLLARTK